MDAMLHLRVRHHLQPGDADEIARVHRRVYCEEQGFVPAYAAEVQRDVEQAARRGWPEAGAVWLPERDAAIQGSLALTFEGENARGRFVGQIRWFALERELRGRGLGTRLLAELFTVAEDQGIDELELIVCPATDPVDHLSRSWGFTLLSEWEREDWRPAPPALARHYVAHLSPQD
jgi:GNAT superfamily N-acetyltransferase